jgi:hypothetical protein
VATPLSLILVSVLAVGAAVVHVAFPSLTIDVVTLGLLAVAALPWLAPVVKWSPQLKAVKSGLAAYLSCSYRGSPEVAKESYELYEREAASDNQRRNLETRERQANLDSNTLRIQKLSAEPGARGDSQTRDGLAWGGTLWRVRTVLGADTADRLIQSWKTIAKEPVLAASASFASTVVELTEQQHGATAATQVQEVFRKRGLVLG